VYFYSSIFIGNYFIFFPSADIYNPISLKFRDKSNEIKINVKNIKRSKYWRKKVYLYPDILQRKWIEYSYKDKFISSTVYDNVSPLKLELPFYTNIGKNLKIKFKSIDYSYKNIRFLIKNINDETVFSYNLKNIIPNKDYSFETTIRIPGIYRILYRYEDKNYFLKSFLIFKSLSKIKFISDLFTFFKTNDFKKYYFFCNECNGGFGFLKSILKDKYLYKDYIPFNNLLDIEKYSQEYINNYILNLSSPKKYNQGLIHLLNIIRLSTSDNEIKIMTNLFNDDPAFAYFITNRLFLFDMIPLINDRELQNILRLIDDLILSHALLNGNNEIKSKIFNNISKRREKSIKNILDSIDLNINHQKLSQKYPSKFKVYQSKKNSIFRKNNVKLDDFINDAKSEINKTIKNYFIEKYGRILKIPVSKRLIYEKFPIYSTDDFIKLFKEVMYGKNINHLDVLHSGNLLIFDGTNIALVENNIKHHKCLSFNFEFYGDNIFNIFSIDENSIYLESLIKIKLLLIHIYDWENNLENIEKFESIKNTDIVPIFYLSRTNILTIGAVDFKGNPYEQVIRISIGS